MMKIIIILIFQFILASLNFYNNNNKMNKNKKKEGKETL